ncbi:MAG: type I methionyl aminopeptidase [bacterium]|nr:type I methionyl aminopeptidase [bacterium]
MNNIQILTAEEKDIVRKSGKLLRATLKLMEQEAKQGVTTLQLDKIAEDFILSHEGALPAFKGYHGYPATLCTSVNDQCVHGLPNNRALQDGDIVSIDCGVLMGGLYTDACVTVPIGNISTEAQKLLDVTEKALSLAIATIKRGTPTGTISSTIQEYVESQGFRPVRSLTGHGLGTDLHQYPDIPNSGEKGTGPELPLDALIAVEPIVSAGADDIREDKDNWTLSITDGGLSAHFEHTLLVTEDGVEVIA